MTILLECQTCRRKFRAPEEQAARGVNCPGCGRRLLGTGPRVDNHDVFISHSTKDRGTAAALCTALERRGIRCWIASRDIAVVGEWAEALIDAIDTCRLVVLVLSAEANNSPQVKREVERASSKDIPIVPVRIENVALSKSMQFYISSQQWYDAFPPPADRHFAGVADVLHKRLSDSLDGPPSSGADKRFVPDAPPRPALGDSPFAGIARPLPLIIAGGSVLTGLLLFMLIIALWRSRDHAPTRASNSTSAAPMDETASKPSGETLSKQAAPVPSTSMSSSLLGTWKLNAASLRELDPQIDVIVTAGRVRESLAEARTKFKEFRLIIEPTAHQDQLYLTSKGNDGTANRGTLSSIDEGKRFQGSVGPLTVTVELESNRTLKATGVPYSLLQGEFMYERAE